MTIRDYLTNNYDRLKNMLSYAYNSNSKYNEDIIHDLFTELLTEDKKDMERLINNGEIDSYIFGIMRNKNCKKNIWKKEYKKYFLDDDKINREIQVDDCLILDYLSIDKEMSHQEIESLIRKIFNEPKYDFNLEVFILYTIGDKRLNYKKESFHDISKRTGICYSALRNAYELTKKILREKYDK